MEKLIEKANVLIEALPFIRNFYGKTFVIKYGGAAQVEDELKNSFAQDIVLMNFIGIKPVIVHGGGHGFVPVISPIGAGSKGEAFNINADYVASAIACSSKAEKFILLTDVPGIKDSKDRVISTISKKEIQKLIDNGTISGGMLPKVQACTRAIDQGVKKTHIVDGRIPHCLLLEIFTNEGIGTEIIGET